MPNQEIKVGLFGSLLPHYLERHTTNGNTCIARMSVLIRQRNMEGALQLLRDFLETVPYCDNTHYEGHYQQMFYIIFALLTNYSIIVEPHTAKGRLDVMMETKTDIYVMEMKFNKSAKEALEQITDRKYAENFAQRGKPVTKIGLNFSQKDGVSSLDWEM